MRIAVFGATGGAGQKLVDKALAAGHDVTAFARNPAALTKQHARLRVVGGEVTNAAAVAAALAGQEGVVVAIGPRPGSPAGTLISDTARHVLAGMNEHHVRRLVFTSGLMVGEARGMGALPRLGVALFRLLNRALYRDKVVAETLVTHSAVDWTIVRPPNFGDVAARGTFRMGVDLDVKIKTMANADVADALFAALTSDAHLRAAVELSY